MTIWLRDVAGLNICRLVFNILTVLVYVSKYMLLSRQQNAGQNRDIKMANSSFENVSQFKYLVATGTNQNLNRQEIKTRLNSGNP
jgi:hypothetical protein